MFKIFSVLFGEIFNLLKHFKAPVKDLFQVILKIICPKKEKDYSNNLEKN